MIPQTIFAFWENQRQRGDKFSALWLIVSMGRIQPQGYIVGWNIRKRHAAKACQDYMTRTGDSATLLRLA
jgi:hypothetical protein